MPMIDVETSLLLMVDFQARLMPAIHDAPQVLRNAARLVQAADMLKVPRVVTEQNPAGLGATVPDIPLTGAQVLSKFSFGACDEAGFADLIPANAQVIITGCEAHVCVLQTVLGLLDSGRAVYVVADATGSRSPDSKAAALTRMARHGAEIVTIEMVLFEWMRNAHHPQFRQVAALIK
ncbi:MAG: isochorismatase family protein [Paracoccus sp. (in: a-proteobacteria)]|uniref:isochorismatase family protein n=1 Tax=Paracoccus sp. TaxID=267 RepID=UPI0026DFB4F5|nr:isochorismatase family protein [Paracoccus sp. (in: a-proteobacteria)]MDO5630729.1 isochorismatase family protein [Paracoccus sp. (in: a-proteobacteria)]